MPDATPARLPLEQALDEGLAALFRQLQAEPTPAALIHLADRLEAACIGSRLAGEARAIG
ncbi:MAG: hypothetical protein ACXU82_16685 [Caulobacteraceae bacterium]